MIESDEILLEKIENGDLASFEILVARYQQKIFAFSFRMVLSQEDARDLTQEVFIQVYRSLKGFRGDSRFSTWVYRIASNKCLDFLRKRKIIYSPDSEQELAGMQSNLTSGAGDPAKVLLQKEKISRLRQLIAGLPDKYRIALILFHYENLSYQQIAETLGVPVKTVATRLYRAKLTLRESLGGDLGGMS